MADAHALTDLHLLLAALDDASLVDPEIEARIAVPQPTWEAASIWTWAQHEAGRAERAAMDLRVAFLSHTWGHDPAW
jgi:hypothetical protein